MVNVLSWLRQPSSVAGLAAFIGTISAIVAGQLSWAQAAPLLAGAAASVVLPDNTAARSETEALVRKLADEIVITKEKVQ